MGQCISQQIDMFLRDGFFNSELGNTMVLALANALGIPITVFSSMTHYPVININPRHMNVPLPVFIAYNHSGCGHYDGVVASPEQTPSHIVNAASVPKGCYCGKSKSDRQGSCYPIKIKYTETLRCPCLKEKVACSAVCCCKDCKNPYGKKPQSKHCRRRLKHQWQVSLPKSGVFALQAGEAVETGPRSLYRSILFYSNVSVIAGKNVLTSPLRKFYLSITLLLIYVNQKKGVIW